MGKLSLFLYNSLFKTFFDFPVQNIFIYICFDLMVGFISTIKLKRGK